MFFDHCCLVHDHTLESALDNCFTGCGSHSRHDAGEVIKNKCFKFFFVLDEFFKIRLTELFNRFDVISEKSHVFVIHLELPFSDLVARLSIWELQAVINIDLRRKFHEFKQLSSRQFELAHLLKLVDSVKYDPPIMAF